MKRHTVIKIRFITGIVIAYAVLIGSFIHYLAKQNTYTENTIAYNSVFRDRSQLVNNFEEELLGLNRIKMGFHNQHTANTVEHIHRYTNEAQEYLNQIATANVLYDDQLNEIRQLQKVLVRITQIDATRSGDTTIITDENLLTASLNEQEIRSTCQNFIQRISTLHEDKIARERQIIRKTITIIVPIGILVLLAILYILYQTSKIIEKIRRYAMKEKKINADFAEISKQIEDNNWILQRTNEIYANISGIDDVQTISSQALHTIVAALSENIHAGAIYIRDIHVPSRFTLQAKYGFANEDVVHSFEKNDGLLGEAVNTTQYRVYPANQNKNISLNTTFIGSIVAPVVLIPLHHDNEVIGLLELVASIGEEEKEKIIEFLRRTTWTIASYIKFGQSHTIVEQLLEQTQKQTEELEAQQEELRITNEELVYKTNLLESSEEELRVQQEELEQSNKELNEKAKELHLRNEDLNQAQMIVEQKIAEVQQASQYKTEFMANMSHELRTPLNSILILAKLLEDNKHQNLDEDQVKYASVIHSAGSDLLHLINELLDLAKIEAGKVDVDEEQISSRFFADDLKSLFKEIAEQKNITFSVDISDFPQQFVSDRHRVEQILKNFLSNAFKFTEQNGQVNARFYLQSDYLHFEVTDSGKGISKEKQDTIFEAFRQEDGSTSRKYGGTGLGLTISRELAILLDGYINLESAPDQGSTFTLVIPFQSDLKNKKEITVSAKHPVPAPPPAQENDHKTSETPVTVRGRKILIVEDDFNFANILKGFAEDYGFDVLLAHDGAKGVILAKSQLPDAIILDVMLPISDGWEVLRELKQDESTKHIPIHMMSAANYSSKEILEKGAIGFLSKPVSADKIEKTFANIMLNIDKDVKKVLLVEDQEVISEYIHTSFAAQNIHVIQAFTLESALYKLTEEENIDCIILDISLPDGDGIDLLEEIRNNPTIKHIPVIINTARELTSQQTEKITRYTKSMVLKDGKSSHRLIDEVNLFLSKINDEDYKPIRHTEKLDSTSMFVNNSVLQNKKVLIVDDDMRNVFALTTSLQEQNMDIEIANNGREAVQLVLDPDNRFDIVLMDIMMPEMDGYEAIEAIRKENRLARLPIIAVTAKAMKGDRERSIQLGANDYVSKPIDINKLISLMQVWLS